MKNWSLANMVFNISAAQARGLVAEFRMAAEQSFNSLCTVDLTVTPKNANSANPVVTLDTPLSLTSKIWKNAGHVEAVIRPVGADDTADAPKATLTFNRKVEANAARYQIQGEQTEGSTAKVMEELHPVKFQDPELLRLALQRQPLAASRFGMY